MDNSVGKSIGAEKAKKTRSLDIQSLYKSKATEEGKQKQTTGVEDNGGTMKKKRKRRKEASLSSFEPVMKKKRKTLVEEYVDRVSSQLGNVDKSQADLCQNLNTSNRWDNVSLTLDDNCNVIHIPKRPRGSIGRKKNERNHGNRMSDLSTAGDQNSNLNGSCKKFKGREVSKLLGPSDSKTSSGDQVVKSNKKSVGKVIRSKVKQKVAVNDFKENKTGKVNSTVPAKEEDAHLVVNNGDASSRKCRSKQRKTKKFAPERETVTKLVEPSIGSSISVCNDFQDDDDDNLEENAARMLSSRFDPSCTGFSSKIRSSGNGFPFSVPSGRNFVSRGVNSLFGSESADADSASRVLRPRRKHKEKGQLRKRRHFYEIHSTDLDAYWILNKKIKVFWPLDESWYYGLVNDYDPERNFHHIKYDDRDEEWINLCNERFKLLLLPTEVPCKAKPEGSKSDKHKDKGKRDLSRDDSSYLGSNMDSEPIITWLARSSLRVKSPPSRALKKRKTSTMLPSSASCPLGDKSDHTYGIDTSSEGDTIEPFCNSALPNKLTDGERVKKSVLEINNSSSGCKLPFVYFRRRIRKKGEVMCHTCVDNKVFGTLLGSTFDSLQTPEEYKFFHEYFCPDNVLWSVDNVGFLKLNIPVSESKYFKVLLSLPLPSILKYISEADSIPLLYTLLLPQYGITMTAWHNVHLEMLFVDNVIGLRFLSFEGCLKQVLSFVFSVLAVFYQPDEQEKLIDLQLPATSIRFKLSCVHDRSKEHVFAFYCFSKVKNSKWLYHDLKLHKHCLLTKQLPVSECTYDNIKAFEGGYHELQTHFFGAGPYSFEGLPKKTAKFNISTDGSKDACDAHTSSSYSVVKQRKLSPFDLSFTAAPTLFFSLHLKLLMERSIAYINCQDQDSPCLVDPSETDLWSISDTCPQVACRLENAEITSNSNLGTALKEAGSSASFPVSHLGTDAVSLSNHAGCTKLSHNIENDGLNAVETSGCYQKPGCVAVDVVVQSEKWKSNDLASDQVVTLDPPLVPVDRASIGKSYARRYSSLSGVSVEIPSSDQDDGYSAQQASDMAWNMGDGFVHSPNPTGLRSSWHRNQNTFSSQSFQETSHDWPDGKSNFVRNGFGNGPKKPRTQVQYTLPFGGFVFSSKQKVHNRKVLPYKRIRRSNERKTSDISRSSPKNLELLACDANVLITCGDKGWRECGARVILQLADRNEWRLAVKLSETTKYSYKVQTILQPGTTNRFTHAMMWRGGKDWVLEFADRSQWTLFKEMHEECHNRNIRAASVKNIPIPGVRLIEDSDDNAVEEPFVFNSSKYIRQIDTDVDMALDPSRILYDMDSDDEQWILKIKRSSDPHVDKCEELSEELFEKTMDTLEKIAYAPQCDHFSSDELEELMDGIGPMEIIKVIYEHWQHKRQRKGMPLIRQLQPPLWERYQHQVKEWERMMTKVNPALSSGWQEKSTSIEKPPMFAFCLKPRGLEVPNKGSKQRSHRKFPVSGHNHAVLGEQDIHGFGRRSNGLVFGDEKSIFPGNNNDLSDASPLPQASSRGFSPRDASGPGYFSLSSDGSEWNHHHPELRRNKSKKIRTLMYPNNNLRRVVSCNQRTIGKQNGIHHWCMDLPQWPSQKDYRSEGLHKHAIEHLDGTDLHEFRLRDASGAARHALNMAKLKRERAQRLFYRADLAIHKAVVALMTADAIKVSYESPGSDD